MAREISEVPTSEVPTSEVPKVDCFGFLDDDDWEVDPENLRILTERYKGQEFPLFNSELASDWESNPNYQALYTILYSDQTAEERAASFREQGNECFGDASTSTQKRSRYEDAIRCYSEGINQNCMDQKLNSLLYSNRAHVRLVLGHFINCVDDCRDSIKCDPMNVKAFFRAAKASFYMRLWKQSLWFCNEGLKVEETNEALFNLKRQSEEKVIEIQRRREQKEREERPVMEEQKHKREEDLNIAYRKRNIEVSNSSDYDTSALLVEQRHMWDSTTDTLHWPCLCLYPASHVSEMILDFSEDTTLLDHLRVMFPSDRFVEWDTDKSHRWDNLCVYYEAGFSDGSMCRVPVDIPLRTILSTLGHVARVPVFHIMVSNSPVERLFCNENLIRPFK